MTENSRLKETIFSKSPHHNKRNNKGPHMKHHIIISAKIIKPILRLLDALKDIGMLSARWWIASIFFASGLTKLDSWGGTLMLFRCTYQVPFLPNTLAAVLGTAAEFIFPIFLVLGLGGRFFVFCFFIYNIVCVFSYHFLWTPAGQAGMADHISWGLLLMLIMLYGSGRISCDHFIHKKWGHLLVPGKKGEKTHWE